MDVSRFDKRRLLVARCALGFASFKVAQSSLYSTAMLTSETTTVLIAGLDFSIASAAFVVLTEAVIVALALLGRLPRLSMPVVAPSLVLAATAVLSYSGALSSVDPAVSLMALAFAQGTATVMLTLAWVEIMTQMELTTSMKTLASSMLLAAAVTLALQNSPSLVMLPCVVATLVASALLYRRAKGIAGNALASGKTKGGDEVTAGAEQKRDRTSLRPYLRGFVSIGEGLLSLLVLFLGQWTNGWTTMHLFCVYRSSLKDPLFYIRLFGHVLGHAGWEHFLNNMLLLLVVGPPMEEKYGSIPLLKGIVLTALVTGVLQCVLFPRTGLLGASGIVFMLIMLSSLAGFSGGIPVTMLLVAALYFGQQVYDILLVHDNVANFMHIVGGLCGTAFGYYFALPRRKRRRC